MPKVILGMIPPSGWHYVESDVRLDAHSFPNLISVVENYRAENHLPIGDVEGDVTSYICSNYPHFCHGVDMVTITSVNPSGELLNDIQTWSRNIQNSGKPVMYVTDELAEERAKTCRGCVNNVNWRGGCSSCISATERLCANVRQARDTDSSAVLGGCNVMRHDNRTAIFLDKEELQTTSNLPSNCWLNL